MAIVIHDVYDSEHIAQEVLLDLFVKGFNVHIQQTGECQWTIFVDIHQGNYHFYKKEYHEPHTEGY